MNDEPFLNGAPQSPADIRAAREKAALLGDQLNAEYEHLLIAANEADLPPEEHDRILAGLQIMAQAINAHERAIASLDEVLRRAESLEADPTDDDATLDGDETWDRP